MSTRFSTYIPRSNREQITGEPDGLGSRKHPLNPGIDWVGSAHRGGGQVPQDLEWTTNPKQWQEESGSAKNPNRLVNEVVVAGTDKSR
jgi:hypothetical protein